MTTGCEATEALTTRSRGLDLEQFRRSRGLTYRKLASLIGSNHASQTRAWAIGESRPDADQLEAIVRKTDGVVTVEAMHQRRLAWLVENKKCTAPANSVAESETVE